MTKTPVPNNSPRPRLRPRVSLKLDQSRGANPADAAGVNINTIMAKYRKHGTLPMVNRNQPIYGDFTFPEDIHSVREAVHQAEDRFNQYSSDVRALCNNDWVEFYELLRTAEGVKKLEAVGLQVVNTPVIPSTETTTTTEKHPSGPRKEQQPNTTETTTDE